MRAEISRMFLQVNGDNVVEMLRAFIRVRRQGMAPDQSPPGSDVVAVPKELVTGPGGVIHILFHAAPHSATLKGLFRAHLGRPMVEAVRSLIPRVDATYGIERTAEEVESLTRVFMSLFAGYFTTSLIFDHQPDDDAIVRALLAIMGWTPPAGTGIDAS